MNRDGFGFRTLKLLITLVYVAIIIASLASYLWSDMCDGGVKQFFEQYLLIVSFLIVLLPLLFVQYIVYGRIAPFFVYDGKVIKYFVVLSALVIAPAEIMIDSWQCRQEKIKLQEIHQITIYKSVLSESSVETLNKLFRSVADGKTRVTICKEVNITSPTL